MPDPDGILRLARPRVTFGTAAGAWAAAELLHILHAPGVEVGLAGALGASITYGVTRNVTATTVAAAGGAWLTGAAMAGPLAGPHWAMSLVLAGGTAAGTLALNWTRAVREARAWKAAKLDWLNSCASYGLHNSHLLSREATRLGERLQVDVSETGKLASSLPHGSLAEIIATRKGLARSRVRITEAAGPSGRIDISLRYKDPWKHAIPHPLLDKDAEIALPDPATIREPLTVGQDPETGKPLPLPLYDSHGGKNVYVIAKRDGGKTTLLDCIRERLTACPDALVLGINLSKASEDLEWAPACHLTAIGPAQARKALRILRLVCAVIDESPFIPRDEKVITPRAGWPAVILVIDEIDALMDLCGSQGARYVQHITSKGRSEAVSFIAAGQRGTAEWMGGANVRANLDVVCAGRVRRQGEINHAVGEFGPLIPDMARYGEGHAGVWAIVDDSGEYSLGRSFNLSALTELRHIAWERRIMRDGKLVNRLNDALAGRINSQYKNLYAQLLSEQITEYHLDEVPDLSPAEAVATAQAAAGGDAGTAEPGTTMTLTRPPEDGQPPAGDGPADPWQRWQEELEQDMPVDDIRAQIARSHKRLADDIKIFNETQIPDMSGFSAEDLAAFREARWAKIAAETKVPAEVRERLLELLAGEGTTIPKAAAALGLKQWPARCLFERLRFEGAAHREGERKASRWKLGPGPDDAPGGDSQ